jgi:hypothetical protein
MRSVAPIVAALALASHAGEARADTPAVTLQVACPALQGETLALFEARARAELAMEARANGRLQIACGGTSATLAWDVGGQRREQTVALPIDDESVVDRLLNAVHALVSQEPARATPQPAASSRAIESRAPPAPDAATAPAAGRFAVMGGADLELWQGQIQGAAGVHLGGRLSLADRWDLVALVGWAFGLESASGLHAWQLRGLARVSYAPLPWLWIGAGGSVRGVWVDASSGLSPGERSGATPGALVSAGSALDLGPMVASVGPDLEILARPITAQLGGAPVFQVPQLVVGASIDLRSR